MKKLLIFLMIAIPIIVIVILNFTVNVVSGMVAIPVDSVSLNITEIEGNIDDSVRLEAQLFPKNASNQDVLWESTNSEVAKVDENGNVSFIGFGKGYITVTTIDGNKKASCYFYITDINVHQVNLLSKEIQNGHYYVAEGETIQLEGSVLPYEALNKQLIFESENEEIATVDANGLVTGIKEGKAKITAYSDQYRNIYSSLIIEVVKPVEYIGLDQDNVIIATSTYQIGYNIYPKNATVTTLLYSVDDESIATVSESGFVKFKKKGEVNVLLESMEGAKQNTIKIQYTDGFATDLIFEKNKINSSINNGGESIVYTVLPKNTDVEVEFSSDNEDVAFVDSSGYIQFMGGGSTIIRGKILTSENEYIEKIISVYIDSPAVDIIVDSEILVGTKNYQLNVSSYPSSSTNKNFYFKSLDESIAKVDENGKVSFLKNEKCDVNIEITANSIDSSVKKIVKLIYTNGYATDIILDKSDIEINSGEFYKINYSFIPNEVDYEMVDFEIISQNSEVLSNVIELYNGGEIKGVNGGTASLRLIYKTSQEQFIYKNINVKVIKGVEDINFICVLDMYQGEYITSLPLVNFDYESSNLDATNKNIYWKLSNNKAIKINEKSINFNSAGIVELQLYSEDGQSNKKIKIRYLKGNLIDYSLKNIPTAIEVGNTFTFEINQLLPSNSQAKGYVKIINQTTLNEIGKCVEIINDQTIRGIAGGVAYIAYNIANLQQIYEIKIIRKCEKINISPINFKTTNKRISLQVEVLPEDASNKNIEYIIKDQSIAYFEGNTLIFKKNGIAEITCRCKDGSEVENSFTIEKIDKGTGEITITGDPILMQIGDKNSINYSDLGYENVNVELKIDNQESEFDEDVVIIEENVIIANQIGSADLVCVLTDQYGVENKILIEVIVYQLAEDIKLENKLDYVNEEFVTALDYIDLEFNLLPSYTTNKDYNISISKFQSSIIGAQSPYIENSVLHFKSAGTAIIKVSSQDGNITKQFRIRYTGGDAIDAKLNIEETTFLNVGDTLNVLITKWIPVNTVNNKITIKEISHSQNVNKVVEINENKITAVSGGESKLIVELSNGIQKEITIIVQTLVENIEINNKYVISDKSIVLTPKVEPLNATNKVLEYKVSDPTIAYMNNDCLIFKKAGSVIIEISTTDGSSIKKEIEVVSTFGKIYNFDINNLRKEIIKGNQFNLLVVDKQPLNCEAVFKYEIVSSEANDGTKNPVVSINQNGLVNALYGGTAIIKVSTEDFKGNIISKQCVVSVISYATDLEISFDRNVSLSQGAYVFAQNNLGFSYKVYPSDSSDKTVEIINCNPEILTIINNKFVFIGAGKAQVEFKVIGINKQEIKKILILYFTNNVLTDIEIDESDFSQVDKQLKMKSGDSYSFKIKTFEPLDKTNIEFSIQDKNENRNDQSKNVIDFDNGIVTALNGGSVSFTLFAGDIKVGRYTFIVEKECEKIEVESKNVYINNNTYQILANVLPSDTTDQRLSYKLINGTGTVDENGFVTFSKYGFVEVKICSLFNENIFETIYIEYTNQIKQIVFNETVKTITFKNYVDLDVITQPAFGVASYEIVFESSNENLATVSQNGIVLAKEEAGFVTIKAYLKDNPSIYVTREFQIVPRIIDIELELNSVNDDLGIGGYHVWGTKFLEYDNVNKKFKEINKYQMNIKQIKPANSGINLVWSSSDTAIATVDKNGLITINKAGKATIKVQPEGQEAPYSQYEFSFYDGINVYSFNEFDYVLNASKIAVLQNDITIDIEKTLKINNNIYGNGYLVKFAIPGSYKKMSVEKDKITIDNIYIRGVEYSQSAALVTLTDKGSLISIEDKKEVLFRHCLLENCNRILEVRGSQVKIIGCIIRNSYDANLFINRSGSNSFGSDVEVEDTIFSKSLLGGILFNPEDNKNANYKNKVTLSGEVLFYNWLPIDEFQASPLIQEYVPDLNEQIKSYTRGTSLIYNYNGQEYLMPGILSMQIQVLGGAFDKRGFGEICFNNPELSQRYIQGSINGSIKFFTIGSANFKLDIFTLSNNNPSITPADTYENKLQEIYKNFMRQGKL